MKDESIKLSELYKAMDWTYKNYVVHQFSELESTNNKSLELADLGKIFQNEIIVAEKQTRGRGRNNRNWESPIGNLYFSLVLKPKITADKVHQISFVAISALRIAIEKLTKKSVENKWPNDLLIEKQKVAGVLLESKINQNSCEFVVIGIGVNINSSPDNTIFPATNLAAQGINFSSAEILKKFLDEFEIIYQNWLDFGFDRIRKIWLQKPYRINQEIALKIDQKELNGIFRGIDQDGNLLLEDNNLISKISVADVSR